MCGHYQGQAKCDLFILSEGNPVVAKNNCLHQLIDQREGNLALVVCPGCEVGSTLTLGSDHL